MNRSTQHAFEPEEIMAYLDGELEAHQAAALASHLEHCGECQIVAAQLRQVSERLLDFQIEPCAMKLEAAAVLSRKRSGLASEAPEAGAASDRRFDGLVRKFVPQSPIGWAAAFGGVAVVLITSIIVLGRFDTPAQHSKNLAREQLNFIYQPKSEVTLPGHPLLRGQKMGGGGGGTIGKLSPGLDSEQDQGAESDSNGALILAPEIRGPMIVQIASITILAHNYDQSSGQIQPLTSARGGYVQDLTAETRTGTARSVSATLRVPDKQLDNFLADLRKLGHVEQEIRNNQEVTDAYIDLTARLKTARATEQRVLQLLGTRTGKLSDVLEAEQELARIRGEIESMDGQRANMEHQVRYATVQVQLNEEYREQLNPQAYSTGSRLRNSLVEGLGNLAGGITGTAVFVFAYGPSILFWLGVIGIPAWFIWRRFRGTTKKSSNQAV
jgi:hypothetical protein